MNTMRRSLGKRGAMTLEFALVLPLFLMVVLGSIEFGRLWWTREALQQTAIAGARCISIAQGNVQNTPCASGGHYNATAATNYILSVAAGWELPISSSNVAVNNAATCGGASGFSQVIITLNFKSVAPSIVLLPVGGSLLTAMACYPNNTY